MADNGQLYISQGLGWSHIGETDGPIEWQPFPPGLDTAAEQKPFLDVQWPPTATVTIKVDSTDALAAIGQAIGAVDLLKHYWDNPGSHSHCRTCHPEQERRPLAVDGQEYNRRRLARQRRKHR